MKLSISPNVSGKAFEMLTNIEPILLNAGFTKRIFEPKSKYGYFLSNDSDIYRVNYFTQSGLKMYSRNVMDVHFRRHPDEAFLVCNKTPPMKCVTTLKIIEKKMQHRHGSIDTKLYAAPLLREEYKESFLSNNMDIHVEYAFCLSSYFKRKEYIPMFNRLEKYDIPIFFGEDDMYFEDITKWIYEK